MTATIKTHEKYLNFLQHLQNELPEESRWITLQQFKAFKPAEIFETIRQFEKQILRPTAKRGENDATYIFLNRILQILYFAGEAEMLNRELRSRLQYERGRHHHYFNETILLTNKLNRYETVEDIMADDQLQTYIERIQRAQKTDSQNHHQQSQTTK